MSASVKIATKQLKTDEGFSGVPYQCTAGKATIGFGRNLEANPLTEVEAGFLLYNDLIRVEQQARKLAYYSQLNPVRQAVILNMVFNLGAAGVTKFKKMEAALIAGDYDQAAAEMLTSRWAGQVGDRAVRLAQQMRTGLIDGAK